MKSQQDSSQVNDWRNENPMEIHRRLSEGVAAARQQLAELQNLAWLGLDPAEVERLRQQPPDTETQTLIDEMLAQDRRAASESLAASSPSVGKVARKVAGTQRKIV